jgi:hypothetical protein
MTNKKLPQETHKFPVEQVENLCLHYIQQNFPFALQSRVNPHASFEVLPLTLQSEIGGHRIISLIKGNC